MKWYPWLNGPYRQILAHYQRDSAHHALLVQSQLGSGELSLCYALSRWLMCRQPNDTKSCGICQSCRLMIAGNHPDFYCIKLRNNQQSLVVDKIRVTIDSLYSRAHQSGVKVMLLLYVEFLAEQAVHALLKILEEPPAETYFLLVCQTPLQLLKTLKSRCFFWPLPIPDEKLGLRWLQQEGFSDPLSACTALRLCSNAPLAAATLLQPIRWQERLALCAALNEIHASNDFLTLLPLLNLDNDNGPLHWLLSLLSDALKFQHGVQDLLVNTDMIVLVSMMATYWPTHVLHTQWQHWIHCLRQLHDISGINRELLLTNYLINWEQNNSKIRVCL